MARENKNADEDMKDREQAEQAAVFLIPMFRWAVGDALSDILNDQQRQIDDNPDILIGPHDYLENLIWVPKNIKEMIRNPQNENEWKDILWNGRRGRLPWDFSEVAKIDEWGTSEKKVFFDPQGYPLDTYFFDNNNLYTIQQHMTTPTT